MPSKDIYVSQPSLPDLQDLIPYLEKIWDRKILTNGGPLHAELEERLAEHLGVPHVSLFSNGTLALIVALKVLGLSGEVITTPYSFVATANSILWNGLTPVFVDIEEEGFNLSVEAVEKAVTDRTSAILPVHCYGYPCNNDEIIRVSKSHNLKVVYDAAHSFGVDDDGGSILRYGDLSILSFHATKVFNTFEGGAIISPDAETKKRVDLLKNFGIENETSVPYCGINGKLNEIQAAVGLLQLDRMDQVFSERKEIDEFYRDQFERVIGIDVPPIPNARKRNYSYFPILVNEFSKISRDQLFYKLREAGIFCRRYFHPLITDLKSFENHPDYRSEKLKNARKVSDRVICLPLYAGLGLADARRVVDVTLSCLSGSGMCLRTF